MTGKWASLLHIMYVDMYVDTPGTEIIILYDKYQNSCRITTRPSDGQPVNIPSIKVDVSQPGHIMSSTIR